MLPIQNTSSSIADVRDPIMDKVYDFLGFRDQSAATQVCKGLKAAPIFLRRHEWKKILNTQPQFETISSPSIVVRYITNKHIIIDDNDVFRFRNHETGKDDFTLEGVSTCLVNEDWIVGITKEGMSHYYDATTFVKQTQKPFHLHLAGDPVLPCFLVGDLLICQYFPADFSYMLVTCYKLKTSNHRALFRAAITDVIQSNSKYIYQISNRQVNAYSIIKSDGKVEINLEPKVWHLSSLDKKINHNRIEVTTVALVEFNNGIHIGENHLFIPYSIGASFFLREVPYTYSYAILDRDFRVVKTNKHDAIEEDLSYLTLEKVSKYTLHFAPYNFPQDTTETSLYDGTTFKVIAVRTHDGKGKSELRVAKVASEIRPPIQIGAKAIPVPEQVVSSLEPTASLMDHFALQQLNSVSTPDSSPIAPSRVSRIKQCLSELLSKVLAALKRLFCYRRI